MMRGGGQVTRMSPHEPVPALSDRLASLQPPRCRLSSFAGSIRPKLRSEFECHYVAFLSRLLGD